MIEAAFQEMLGINEELILALSRFIHAGGGLEMRFTCLDAACQPAVDVKIRTAD